MDLTRREAWAAPAYFALYLIYLFVTLESELLHWLTLVALPLALSATLRPQSHRTTRGVLATLGLRRGTLSRGLGWALLAGIAVTAFQVFFSNRATAIQALIADGRALLLFPLTFALMMALAGFTEEFFFRGFLQTRLERLAGSKWLAVALTAILFGVYHLPYAYLNPRWPSAGDWSAAWTAALGNGVPGGLMLGALYVVSRENLLACVLLHSLMNAAPAMTMIRLSSG